MYDKYTTIIRPQEQLPNNTNEALLRQEIHIN